MVSTISDPSRLTPEQQGIIVAAMEDQGRFQIATRSDTNGKAVRTKDQRFFDQHDRDVARRFVEAVRELERLLFVRECGRRHEYELTNFGWLIGRKLAQERKEAGSES